MFVCEKLAKQDAGFTVKECEAIFRCVKELEKTVLPDRQRSDRLISYPTSHR